MAEKRKRGRPKTDARLDIWFGVEDAKERKRIQDRLAQRTRRKFWVSRTCLSRPYAVGGEQARLSAGH